MQRTIHALSKQIENLEEENKRLKMELVDKQQIIYLKRGMLKQAEIKNRKLKKDCDNLEQAFENYVNEAEQDKLYKKIEIDMIRARVREKLAS
jgi:predicted  nucleic acid-binding Zn-ribbon protein